MQHLEGGKLASCNALDIQACHAAQSACAHTPNNKMTQQKKSAVRASRHYAAQAKQETQLTNYTKSGAQICQSNLHQISDMVRKRHSQHASAGVTACTKPKHFV